MAYALPAIFALFVWWFSTGAIIWLDGLPQRTFKWSMAGATLLALAGLYGLSASAGGTELVDAYVAFASVMAVWAWVEIQLLHGLGHRAAEAPLPAWLFRLAPFRPRAQGQSLARVGDRRLPGDHRLADLGCAQPDRAVDLPHPVVDA